MGQVKVLIHADVIEDVAREQVETIKDSPAFKGLIAIMPDVHAGAGCVIGFTGKFDKAVIPNVVGVDIGCGVSCYKLGQCDILYDVLDKKIREVVPLGFNNQPNRKWMNKLDKGLLDEIGAIDFDACVFYGNYPEVEQSSEPVAQLGTLGGGNHFIEIDVDSAGNKYLIVHSGSRNFGLKVANYFQKKAKQLCKDMLIETGKDLEYLPMKVGGSDYIKWLHVAQKYAHLNRKVITKNILNAIGITFDEGRYFESVHNYISGKDGVVRKGAISAHVGEQVIIPLTMADGCVLGKGKGVSKYNYSAPHGAGRTAGRKEMQRRLANPGNSLITMKNFEDRMDGIYSTSISSKTIDESPFAYKHYDSIRKHVEETVDVEMIIKPVYNLKSE